MLEIGICDDERACAQELEALLRRYLRSRGLEAGISVFTSAEALLRSDWQRFSILFLDVVMERKDGVSAAAEIRRKNPEISLIFVSAFLDYATMGYQVKASAYLLKQQLAATLDGAMDAVLAERQLNRDQLSLTVEGREVFLPLAGISYLESQGKLTLFHGQTELSAYRRFSDLETVLAAKGFLRIHRCYIVNLAHCVAMKNYQAFLDSGETLPCSRRDYGDLVRRFLRWKGLHP